MEILNRNQRRGAIARLLGWGLLLVALNGFVLYSYDASGGVSEQRAFERLKRKLEQEKRDLNDKLIQCAEADQTRRQDLEDLKDRLKDLAADLKHCEKKLELQQLQNKASE